MVPVSLSWLQQRNSSPQALLFLALMRRREKFDKIFYTNYSLFTLVNTDTGILCLVLGFGPYTDMPTSGNTNLYFEAHKPVFFNKNLYLLKTYTQTGFLYLIFHLQQCWNQRNTTYTLHGFLPSLTPLWSPSCANTPPWKSVFFYFWTPSHL